MSAELIREHFTQHLGVDVGVSFRHPDDPREVTRTERFYASTCPVCRQLALEALVTDEVVQVECGRCGGFVTATARSMLAKSSEEKRKAWLRDARRQVPANRRMVLVDAGGFGKA